MDVITGSSSLCRAPSAGDGHRVTGVDLPIVWVESALVKGGKHFLPVSRWDEDVLHSELRQTDAQRTQHLRSSVCVKQCKAEEGANRQAVFPNFTSDVQRTVGRSNITDSDQENIYQSPNAQTSKAEQLPQTLSPLAQVKPVCPKTTEGDAEC